MQVSPVHTRPISMTICLSAHVNEKKNALRATLSSHSIFFGQEACPANHDLLLLFLLPCEAYSVLTFLTLLGWPSVSWKAPRKTGKRNQHAYRCIADPVQAQRLAIFFLYIAVSSSQEGNVSALEPLMKRWSAFDFAPISLETGTTDGIASISRYVVIKMGKCASKSATFT